MDDEVKKRELEGLIKMAQNGDKDAFGDVYDLTVDQIYRYIYFKVPKTEVEDLLETVFLKAWENLQQYKPKKAAFTSWLYRIAHNLVIDFYRLNRGIAELTEEHIDHRREGNPVKVAENGINSEILRTALDRLNPNYSQFILLKFVNDLSNAEIAIVLKKSEGSLRILQHRALKDLRKVLDEMGVDSFSL